MDYITQLNAFDNWLEYNSLDNTAQIMWYKLMSIANKSGWKRELSIANTKLMAKVGLSEKALINCRNRLVQSGLIQYKNRGTKKAGIYIITVLYDSNDDGGNDSKKNSNGYSNSAVTTTATAPGYINNIIQDKTKHGSSEKRVLEKDAGGAVSYWLNQVNPEEAPKIMQDINYWVADFGGSEEIVKMAIDEMLSNGARNYNYLNKVLKSWESSKLDTPEKVRNHLKGYYEKANRPQKKEPTLPVFDEEYLRKEAEKYGVEWEE
ncbi:DnaD domain-containing protein [Enterococcus faecalis]|uniref:DnaD domain-containing protein n=1 Tax=Enterococcus faecalis TaxID=1351 RepID=UPI000352C6BE|nr:DnaD domain protein [Enterococcus faecalis]EPI39934.1 DnaD domain protein [Enterococcus faecalis LA3B-2]